MKKHLLTLGITVTAASFAAGQSIYFQPFDNTIDQSPIETIDGWSYAVHDGVARTPGNSAQQYGNLSNVLGGLAYNANSPHGGSEDRGILTWTNGGAVPLNIAQTTPGLAFSVLLGHNSADAESRFAIRVDNDWFVAAQPVSMASPVQWASGMETGAETYELAFTTSGSAWAPLAYDSLLGADSSGFELYIGPVAGLAGDLPAGAITAVGIYNYTPEGSVTRYDDFTVIPEPSAYAAVLGLIAAALLVLRSRRR